MNRLRQIQEEEYKEAEKLMREQEENQKREEEMKFQKEEEEKKLLELQKEAKRKKMENLEVEPAENEPNLILVLFRLPNGSKISRRFRIREEIQVN